jgi:hypothetical protein
MHAIIVVMNLWAPGTIGRNLDDLVAFGIALFDRLETKGELCLAQIQRQKRTVSITRGVERFCAVATLDSLVFLAHGIKEKSIVTELAGIPTIG